MRRGQMEILGLAIVVVLIMMGVLFAVVFVLRAPSTDTAASYRESQLASSMVTAILGTTTSCNDATVTELLQDCAVFTRISCGGGTSCDAANDAINQMLQGTLDVWQRDYRFSISGGSIGIQDIKVQNGKCDGEIEASENPVPTAGGALLVRLDLCS